MFLGSTGLIVASTPEARLAAISWIIVGSIYIVYYCIFFIAGIGLIMAVRHVSMIKIFPNNKKKIIIFLQRDHYRMKLIMIIMVIGIFIALLSLIINLFSGLGSAIFWICVQIYFFICIYSLYKKIEEEQKGNNVVLQPITPHTMAEPI